MTYFPKDYHASRAGFKRMITDLPGPKEVGEWRVPSRTDDDLFVDWTYLPATLSPERLIVLSSGVHGLETYAGSAIQTMFLKELWPSINRSQTGFLIVHALNPWGFKHHRRSTENHVNLNRNCSAGTEMYRLKNPRGAELTKRFVPEEPLRPGPSRLARAFRWREGKPFFDDIPMDELIRAICLGQFEDPKGLEFGGFEAEPQIQFLTLKLKSVMPYYRDVILLDLHTGLGGRGKLHVLTGDTEGSVHPGLFGEMLDPKKDHSVYEFTPADQEGFYKTHGALNNIFPELAAPDQRVCALTMEFGTLGHEFEAQLESLNRWMLEHQGLFYGYADSKLEREMRAGYLEKFAPRDPVWRENVVNTARKFIDGAFTKLGVKSK